MAKLLLLDGNSLTYRAFFALPTDMATSSGQVTNAVFGFTSMLINLLRDQRPDGVVVLFDRPEPTFRHEAVPEYKAQREAAPDILRQQKAASEKLSSLKAAIALMAKAHHDLTAEAQGKNPESFKTKLQDLANAASDLGSFYSSLE